MKKTWAGYVLLLVGAFLLVLALVLLTMGPRLFERTPLNVDSNTYLSGQAQKLNPATGQVDDVPVAVLNKTQVDAKKSDGNTIVFVSYACVNIDRGNPPACLKAEDDRLITNSVDSFAADRRTGEAVNGSPYLPVGTPKHEGLVNKFPFHTGKKTYQYWNSLLGKTVPATYAGTTTLQGLKTYQFKIAVPATPANVAGSVKGTYQYDATIWVEPFTGAIVNQTSHDVRLLPDGSTVLNMNLAFTDATVKSSVSDAKSNISKLRLITLWIPIAGLVLGLAALVLGGLMVRRGSASQATGSQRRETAGV